MKLTLTIETPDPVVDRRKLNNILASNLSEISYFITRSQKPELINTVPVGTLEHTLKVTIS